MRISDLDLTEHHGVKRMRIVLDGKRVGKGCSGYYLKNREYFTKRGLKKRTVLHELYHHLVEVKDSQMPLRKEERDANSYARDFLKVER